MYVNGFGHFKCCGSYLGLHLRMKLTITTQMQPSSRRRLHGVTTPVTPSDTHIPLPHIPLTDIKGELKIIWIFSPSPVLKVSVRSSVTLVVDKYSCYDQYHQV